MKRKTHQAGLKKGHRTRATKRATPGGVRTRWLLFVGALVGLILACNLGSTVGDQIDLSSEGIIIETPPELTLEEALAGAVEDRRGTVLEEMGAPDVFTIVFEDLEGTTVRSEQWSYLDYGSRFDFIDGELLWTIDLEPVPDGSIYAHFYDPLNFTSYMSINEVRALLEDQELLEVDLTEADLPGGMMLVGDQIVLGFDQGRLVYVETLILSPEGAS